MAVLKEKLFSKDKSHYEDRNSPSPPGYTSGNSNGKDKDIGEGPSDSGPVHDDHRSESSLIDHVEEKGPVVSKVPRRKRIKQHCRRYWLWYLICQIVFLAILLPLLFTVIFAAIVQKIVDNQELPVKSGAWIAISPNQLNISLETSLKVPLPAALDPMTLFLYNKDTPEFSPFINLSFPEEHVNGETNIGVVNQTVTITNETELVKWFSNVFDERNTTVSNRGDTIVRLGALHYSAHIDKTVEIPTLNKLLGYGIQELHLILPPDDAGNNVQGTLNLPNWSRLALGLGNLTLNILSGDIRLGTIFIANVTLPPGNTTFPFIGQLDIRGALANIGPLLESQAEPLSRGMLKIGSSGNKTEINGERIPFIEKVLNTKRIDSEIGVITLVSQVLGGLLSGEGGSRPLMDVITDIVGNKTLIEDVLTKLNGSGIMNELNSTKSIFGRPSTKKRSLPVALNLFKASMRMRKH